MPIRHAEAHWEGNVMEGSGSVKLGSGAFEGPYSFKSRFGEGAGTNPEELIGAAHAGCFSMALSLLLERAGYTPRKIDTSARVRIDQVGEGFKITRIELSSGAKVDGIDEEAFRKIADAAKKNCPVSVALAGTEITLEAKLLS